MFIQFGQALGDYLYDVFVAKFDFWLAFGLVAQLLFTARFLVQWISSERAGRSVIPIALRSAIPGAIFDFSKRVITRHNEPHGSGFSVTEGPLIALAISDFRITGDPGGPRFRPSKS